MSDLSEVITHGGDDETQRLCIGGKHVTENATAPVADLDTLGTAVGGPPPLTPEAGVGKPVDIGARKKSAGE